MAEGFKPLLEVERVSISYATKRGALKAVSGVSFTIGEHESVALIGESGCGKTTLATSIVDALPMAASVTKGKLLYHKDGRIVDLLELKHRQLRLLLWSDISMVFQASQSSFNPVRKIKTQFLDTVWAHDRSQSKQAILQRSAELLRVVMLDPEKVLNAYPHELSGGMKQRTLIALALLLRPKLVILDEPTTALDLLTQEKILRLLNELKKEYGFSLLFITHDLGIVSELADKVVTMYAGKAVEIAPVRDFFKAAAHPYSRGLVNAIPRLTLDDSKLDSIPGTPPDMVTEEHGCAFAPRCSRCTAVCLEKVPVNTAVAGTDDRFCACWNPLLGGENSGKAR